MRVQFNGSTRTYECSEPIEQKVFKSGAAVGWAIMFHVYGNFDSTQIDSLITPDAISNLVFLNEDSQNTSFTIPGYSAVTACVIRHKAAITVTELQFTKASETETTTQEGVVENGEV